MAEGGRGGKGWRPLDPVLTQSPRHLSVTMAQTGSSPWDRGLSGRRLRSPWWRHGRKSAPWRPLQPRRTWRSSSCKAVYSRPAKRDLAKLARAVGGNALFARQDSPRTEAKQKPTIFANPSNDGEGQRTQVTVTAFRGWDLPGPGAGSLEFTEQSEQIDQIELVSGQPTTAPRASHNRSCDLNAPGRQWPGHVRTSTRRSMTSPTAC